MGEERRYGGDSDTRHGGDSDTRHGGDFGEAGGGGGGGSGACEEAAGGEGLAVGQRVTRRLDGAEGRVVLCVGGSDVVVVAWDNGDEEDLPVAALSLSPRSHHDPRLGPGPAPDSHGAAATI